MRDFVDTGSLKKWILCLCLMCPSEHPKLKLSIDGHLCINTFYIFQLLFLPHECGQIHQTPPILSMTQTRECTREQMYTVPRMGPKESSRKSRFPKYFKFSKPKIIISSSYSNEV